MARLRITNPKILLIAIGLGSLLFVGSFARADEMVSASGADHLWFVVPTPDADAPLMLYHHAREMEGPYLSPGRTLPEAPLAMAAWDNQVWMIFPAKPGSDPPKRETLTAQIYSKSSLGFYYYDPPDQFGLVDSLSGMGNLVGFVGTADGPIALRIPTQSAGIKIVGREGSTASDPVLKSPVLEQLHGQRWKQISLPSGFSPGSQCVLVAIGKGSTQLVILSQESSSPGSAILYRRVRKDQWVESKFEINLGNLRAVTTVDSQIVLAMQEMQESVLSLSYLRQDSLLKLTELPLPKGLWTLVGLSDGLRFIEQTNQTTRTIRHIDSIDGSVGLPLTMQSQRLLVMRAIHIPIIFGLGVTILVIVIITRGGAKTTPATLPDSLRISAPTARLAAVFIDLLASVLVVSLVFQYPINEFSKLPVWTTDILDTIPVLLVIGLTFIHSMICESIFGKTLGKSLLGLRVVTAQAGVRASFAATLVRNLLKLIVLLIPVLVLVGLGNPQVQGLSDLMARTVVCQDKPKQDAESPKDR